MLQIAVNMLLLGWSTGAPLLAQTQTSPAEEFLGKQPEASKGSEAKKEKPYSLTAGPEGAILKGDNTLAPAKGWGSRLLVSPYATVLLDGSWSPMDDALNNASITLRPSLALQRIKTDVGGPTTHGPWFFTNLDVRQRRGRFKDEATGQVDSVNQTILGAGVEFKFVALYKAYSNVANKTKVLNDFPRLGFTYYSVEHNSEPRDKLPEEIVADQFQAFLRGEFRFPWLCRKTNEKTLCPFVLKADATESKPTEGSKRNWSLFGTVSIQYDTGTELKPAVTYRSGKEQGLKYDRQLILGLLWEFGKQWIGE